jgi:hypothetical protein
MKTSPPLHPPGGRVGVMGGYFHGKHHPDGEFIVGAGEKDSVGIRL